jgi:hypothetical protein
MRQPSGLKNALFWQKKNRIVARGIIEGSKRPFFFYLADPSQQV